MPFSLPEVIEELKLTDSQQQQMHQLVHRSSEAMLEINARWQGSSRQRVSEIRAQMLEAARQEALDVLTDEQRARWLEIVGPAEADGP